MMVKRGSRVGVAAFLLGLSLAGPHSVAVASADDTDAASPAASADDRQGKVRAAGSARPERAASREMTRNRGAAPSLPDPAPETRRGRSAAAPAAAAEPASATPSKNTPVSAPAAGRDRQTVSAPAGPVIPAGRPTIRVPRTPAPNAAAGPSAASTAQSVPARAAASAPSASAAAPGGSGCRACWGVEAPGIGQAINTVINHLFNSTFDWVATLPGGPLSNLLEGALVLVRRSLFLSPLGVTATQVGSELTVSVNTGSVAYFRQDGTSLQVSGVPLFGAAKTFDAATVSEISVGNPGNAGCAGLVVDSGLIAADLGTSQIDAIRFDSGAAVAGTVTAAVTGGPLALRNAVRGLNGVEFNAPVTLGNDVEVDAGDGDATFNGTVDAAKAGEQSLTVTAAATTTFTAAVGGQAALESLTTRGIEPLRVEQSADTTTIPLYYMPQFGSNGQEQVKYGIDVALGDNDPRTFVFDTGGNGFYAGYNPDYWQGVTLGTNTTSINYTSGTFYDAIATDAVVTIGPTGGPRVSTVRPVQVGAIVSAGNVDTGQTYSFTNPYAPPVDGRFSGDFGAAFGVQPVNNEPTGGLSSVLFQLPGNLSSGYLVQLGPVGTTASLTVGVTEALRAQFPYAIPVTANSGGGTYPVSGYQVLEQFGFNTQYFVQQGDGPRVPLGTTFNPKCAAQCLPSLIDSGAPSTNVRLPGVTPPYPYAVNAGANSLLTPGTTFIAQFPTTQGRPPLEWSFIAGTNGSVNQVGYSPNGGAAFGPNNQNVNTGLNLFNDFDIMFDVEKQVIWLRPNGGQSQVSLQSVTTTGAQDYRQNADLAGSYRTDDESFSVGGVATLTGDTVVSTGSGDVTFSGTVDGPHDLEVNSTGATTFVRPVGGLTPQSALTTLTTDAGGSTSTASVTTAGDQSYADAVTLTGNYQVNSGAFTVGGSATLAGNTAVTAVGGNVTFSGSVDSTEKTGYALRVTTDGRLTRFQGTIGSSNPLGGLNLINSGTDSAATVTADAEVTLDGSLGYAGPVGLGIGDNVTVSVTSGTISNFTGSGAVFYGESRNSTISNLTIANNVYDGIQIAAAGAPIQYDYADTRISNNTIIGNGAFGIETAAPVSGLTITGNTIGAPGEPNQWNYVTLNGPNVHGIVLAPGVYDGTLITDNNIASNLRSGIYAPKGVQQLLIRGNTLSDNGNHGIEFADGDFAGTTISENIIKDNTSSGISLGAGIGQGTTTGGNPLAGYSGSGHYIINYANNVDFYDPAVQPGDPQIAVRIGSKTLQVNMDTGSRGLYFDELQLDSNILDQGVVQGPGHVYLNSSNRLYFGNWVQLPVTFTDSFYEVGDVADTTRQAVADMPVLVVEAIGASLTPKPGQTEANTTFGTLINSGTVTITDGKTVTQAPIVPNLDPTTGKVADTGTVTIPGGFYAFYKDNVYTENGQSKPILAPVGNFGVGFDRSGLGTAPTTNGDNQAYNAFLNLTEMRTGEMRPGYVITTQNVKLGLDDSVDGFAYTNLAPSGLTQGTQSAPDWQPATGTVAVGKGDPSNVGPLVLDMGYPGGILTLPGAKYAPTQTFSEDLTVNLLNSGGKVRYTITANEQGTYTRTKNLLNPAGILLFDPLPGAYTQNAPPLSQQFFNTGRNSFAAFQYLYDAAGGYLGLRVDPGREQGALDSAKGEFTADFYANDTAPTKATNLTIESNTIADNGGFGIAVTGSDSSGIQISGNSIFLNTGLGIALLGGANGGQSAPTGIAGRLTATNNVRVSGSVSAVPGYTGDFIVQVFGSPSSDTGDVEGRYFLGEFVSGEGDFTGEVPADNTRPGDWITLTVTPKDAPKNTSQFSAGSIVLPPAS